MVNFKLVSISEAIYTLLCASETDKIVTGLFDMCGLEETRSVRYLTDALRYRIAAHINGKLADTDAGQSVT